MVQTGYAAYQAATRTVTSLEAVVMLYDGVIVHIKASAEAARNHDYLTQFNEVRKAADILNGLNRCLNMEVGGEVAQHLRDMYVSVVKALMRTVGSEVGPECCEKLAAAVRLTRDAWAEIAANPPVPAGQPAPSPELLNNTQI